MSEWQLSYQASCRVSVKGDLSSAALPFLRRAMKPGEHNIVNDRAQGTIKSAPAAPASYGTPNSKPASSPAHQVVLSAMKTNATAGNENLGALSFSHGFMPLKTPLLCLPQGFEAWEELGRRLPSLYSSMKLRPFIEGMPTLHAATLPDEFLHRVGENLSANHGFCSRETKEDSFVSILPFSLNVRHVFSKPNLSRTSDLVTRFVLDISRWGHTCQLPEFSSWS